MSPYNAKEQERLASLRVFDARLAMAIKWIALAMAALSLVLAAACCCWTLTGCAGITSATSASSRRTASPVVTSGNVYRLQHRPDAGAAVQSAPEWCRDALHTIIDLEAELKEAKAAK